MNPIVLVVVRVLETKSTGRGRGRRRGRWSGSVKAQGRRPALQSPDSWSSRAPSFERLSGCRSVTAGTLRVAGRVFFFFQAEDGIRDLTVTGVQTCALPI